MERLVLAAVIGGAAAIWALVYTWVDDPFAQALMIFFTIVGAARAAGRSHEDQLSIQKTPDDEDGAGGTYA